MSSTSDKPPRKTLRLKREPEADDTTEAAKPARRKTPVRWSPLQRSRARPTETPPEAAPDADRPSEAPPPRRRAVPSDSPRKGAPRGEAAPSRPPRSEKSAERPRQGKRREVAHRFFAACPRGLEGEVAEELAALGGQEIEPGSGGVAFAGDFITAWRANLWSRLAIRVLWRVGEGQYRGEEDLYRAALALPWPEWFDVGRSIAVRTVAHMSPLKSLNFVTLKIKDAVCDRFRQDCDGRRPDVDARAPDVPILVYLERETFSLYIDLSDEPLNRPGYRVEPAPAPLNENLAAGLLRLAGWTPEVPLLDPMMGGGTLLIEAALIALDIAPGIRRHFAFENLANFDRVEWARLRKDAQAGERERGPLPLYGCDIDPAMVRATGINLKAAGLLECVAIDEGDVMEIPPPEEAGMIVSNPPYGVRLESDAVFYKGLGDALKRHFAGWSAWFLTADPEFPKHIGLKASRRVPLFNGPLDCRLLEYRLVAGGNRGKGSADEPA